VKGFLDTGFLLTILTHRSGAEKAWGLLKDCETPTGVSSLQLFFVRHGLTKTLVDPNATKAVQEISVSAIKLLNWMLQQEVIHTLEIDYQEAVTLAEAWTEKLRTPIPTLLLIWSACATVSGADTFLSFDPRTRALAKGTGLKVIPERL
jgi:hypothetical protein